VNYLELCQERCPQDIPVVRDLGNRIGYGHLMHLASAVWGAKLGADGHSGKQFAVGCGVAFMVPCQCQETPPEDHCDWCCGTGRVTIRVAEAQKTLASPLAEDWRGKAIGQLHGFFGVGFGYTGATVMLRALVPDVAEGIIAEAQKEAN